MKFYVIDIYTEKTIFFSNIIKETTFYKFNTEYSYPSDR